MSNGLHELALVEPWRTGQGRPRNALDPTWEGYDPPFCNGELWWEGSTPWWTCTKCGYISCWKQQQHYPIESPLSFFLKGLFSYLKKRREQQLPLTASLNQALFIAGVALRYAAAYNPERIGWYIQEQLVVK